MTNRKSSTAGLAARLLRSGWAGREPGGTRDTRDAGLALRNVARELRDELDKIKNHELLTPSERRAASERIVRAAREDFGRAKLKLAAARDSGQRLVDGLADLMAQLENRVTPLALRRLEMRAAQVRELSPAEQALSLQHAEAAQDLEALLAHSIVSPEAAVAARTALMRVARPEQLALAQEAAQSLRDSERIAAAFEIGFEELAAEPDSYLVAQARGEDFLAVANGETPVVRGAQTSTALWPSWVVTP